MNDHQFLPSRLNGGCLLLLGLLLHFSATAQYVLNGRAVALAPESFRLTVATTSQSGSVWFQNKLNLNSDFEIKANLYLGASDGGADGIAFVLQPICSGLGALGGGIGYQGINPSLAVEFDTWQNAGNFHDPVQDHIGLQKNGNPDHDSADKLAGPFTLSNLENNQNHPVIIKWTKASNNLRVTLDGVERINYSGDIIRDIFQNDPQVFWGFTAATGAAFNVQTVTITGKSFLEEKPYAVQLPSCPNSNDGAISLNVTGNQGPFTFTWSNGSTQKDQVNIASNVYTVTVTDRNNCKSQYTIDATVTDKQAPTISCPADMTLGNDDDACSAKVDFTAKASDNCTANPSISYTPTSGSQFKLGATTVVSTAKDESGNTANCKFTITVVDKQAPVITCPAPVSVKNDPGVCGAKVTFAPKATDNCPGTVKISNSHPSGSLFPVGVTTVVSTGTDVAGNKSACKFTVTVSDKEAPKVGCPVDIAVNNDPGVCGAKVTFAAKASDNCTATPKIKYSTSPGSLFPVGQTTVMVTAYDQFGNNNGCKVSITVSDKEAPKISCPADIGVNNDPGICGAKVDFSAKATDNCTGDVFIGYSTPPGSIFPVGVTAVTSIGTDDFGNSAKCSFSITVKDNEPPNISCPPHLTLSCESSTKPNVTGEPTATDNCAADKFDFTDSKTTSICPGNFKINRTWKSMDIHGNASTCLQAITFEDNTPPKLSCPPNVTVTCDVGPNPETGKADAVDNCDASPKMEHADKQLDGDCAWLCTIERTWLTTDNCNNTRKCVQVITRNTLPLLEKALRQDTNGDGVTDTLTMGASQNTLTLPPGTGNCIQKWLPSKGTVPVGLEHGKIMVDASCRAGANQFDANGKLTDPLVAEALKLNIMVRLNPPLGTTKVNTLNCSIAPIVLQNLGRREESDVNELLRVTDTALGKIALQPHLKELLEALTCINGSLEVCK